jgi:hypothetical protein
VSIAWRRSEPRLVRPFFAAEMGKGAVARAQIRLINGSDFSDATSHHLDEIDLPRLRPVLQPNLQPSSGWLPSGYRSRDFCLIVWATNAFLRKSIVITKLRLDGNIPAEVEIPADILVEFGGRADLDIEVAVCLEHDNPAKPGLPFLAGHWLSRKTFTIRERLIAGYFDIQTRTDEQWQSVGFPPKTLYAVEYIGGMNEPSEEVAKVATVYVHNDAYNRLTSDDRGVGRLLQPILAAEMTAQILEASLDDWCDSDEVTSGSPLSTVLKKLADFDTSLDLNRLKSLMQPPERPRLRAILQESQGAVRTIIEA